MKTKLLFALPLLSLLFAFSKEDSSSIHVYTEGTPEEIEPEKGYVMYKEKIGHVSFTRVSMGEHVCDAAIVDMNGLTQGVKHLKKVSTELKEGSYGKGDRATYTQLKRIRTGVDAEISYVCRISNARIGDSLMIDVGGETIAEISSDTEGDIIATFYLTSIGKGKDEAKCLTNKAFKGGLQTFNIADLLGPVVPGKNDYVSFTYLPKEENNLNNPAEKVKFKVLRYEKLKTTATL